MASIQGPNPLDRLAPYFKPCTRQFAQEDYNDIEDTLADLRERQKKNPLDVLDVFFRPFTKKFDYTDHYNEEIHNPFADKIEIGNSIKVAKIKSTKRRRVDSLDDDDKSLPSLSLTTMSSDTSSSESSDDEGDSESFMSLMPSEHDPKIFQDDNNKLQFDDSIIEDLETLCLISDNPNTAAASRKIAKPKSKKQVAVPYDPRSSMVLPENDGSKGKEDEVLRTVSRSLKKFKEGEKGAQKFPKKNGAPEVPGAGFTGGRTHKYLDMLDNLAFKARHQKIITKRFPEATLSGGLSSLLSGGFKPAATLE